VHAIGKLDGGELSLVSFTVSNLHSSPSGVPSGAPSGAPADAGVPAWLLVSTLAGLAVVAVSVTRLRAER
jgi:hypothetical protein